MLETLSMQPVIEADRFVLRPLRVSDAGLVSQHCSDRRVACATTHIPHPLPPGTVEAMIDRASRPNRAEDIWVIDGTAHGHSEVMGLLTLTGMDRSQDEIRYWVAPGFWNTGLASEAVRRIIAANPHRARHVFAEVFQDNPASARVLTNCGFDYLGDAEAFSVARGSTVPTWTYSLKLDT